MKRGSRYLAGTKVAVPTDPGQAHAIFGFYTLLYHEYRDGELATAVARKLGVKGLGRIPMILLAQLGVRKELQNQGLGRLLMQAAMELALSLAQEAGSVAMITDPKTTRLADYYADYGFTDIGERNPTTRQPRLFLPMKTIEAAYRTALDREQ